MTDSVASLAKTHKDNYGGMKKSKKSRQDHYACIKRTPFQAKLTLLCVLTFLYTRIAALLFKTLSSSVFLLRCC